MKKVLIMLLFVVGIFVPIFSYAQESIFFKLVGNELLRQCPKAECKIIQYGTADATATINELSGQWYKVTVEERGVIKTLNDAPYVKIVKLAKPITTVGWYYQTTIPKDIRVKAESFFTQKEQKIVEDNINSSSNTSPQPASNYKLSLNVSPKQILLLSLFASLVLIFILLRKNKILRNLANVNIKPKFVVGSLVISTFIVGTYFIVSEYRRQQMVWDNSLQLQQEALQKSQKEIEDLKNSEAARKDGEANKIKVLEAQVQSIKNQKPAQVVIPSTNSNASLIRKFARSIVKLTCSVDQNTVGQGSGTLFFNPDDNTFTVFTNNHVIATDDGSLSFCIVTVYPNSPSLEGALAYTSKADSFIYFGGLDISAFSIEPIDDSIGQSLYNQPLSKPLAYLQQLALDGKQIKLCDDSQVGEKLFVLGYPAVGGDSLTVTDGIVAGVERDGDTKYYKTSAKIEHGNSGGAAILESGCFLGIPTLAVSGSVESIAYILPLQ
jgi:flagellar biosynthesis protein FliP